MSPRAAIDSRFQQIWGYCPMGCGGTLFLGDGGHVTCSLADCPNPSAVDSILGQRETEHIVVISDLGFDILHPLREQVDGEMFDCDLHGFMSSLSGPPAIPGRYRVVRSSQTAPWRFEPTEAEDRA